MQETARDKFSFSGISRRAILAFVILLLLIVGAGFAYAFYFQPSDPADTLRNLVSGIEALDTEQIVACFDTDTKSEVEDMMDNYGGSMSELLDITSDLGAGPDVDLKLGKISYEDNENCSVPFTIKTEHIGEKASSKGTFTLHKENGKWVIKGSEEFKTILDGLY